MQYYMKHVLAEEYKAEHVWHWSKWVKKNEYC